MNYSSEKMSTPCRAICQVNGHAGICTGCGRQLKEIAGWSRMSEAERLAIMAALPQRLAEFEKT